jgi:hypothetical protein
MTPAAASVTFPNAGAVKVELDRVIVLVHLTPVG